MEDIGKFDQKSQCYSNNSDNINTNMDIKDLLDLMKTMQTLKNIFS